MKYLGLVAGFSLVFAGSYTPVSAETPAPGFWSEYECNEQKYDVHGCFRYMLRPEGGINFNFNCENSGTENVICGVVQRTYHCENGSADKRSGYSIGRLRPGQTIEGRTDYNICAGSKLKSWYFSYSVSIAEDSIW